MKLLVCLVRILMQFLWDDISKSIYFASFFSFSRVHFIKCMNIYFHNCMHDCKKKE